MHDLIRDWRYALRRLGNTPGFALAALVTLALGIGANTAIFSIVNGVLLKPLPFHEPDRLIGVWQTAPGVKIKDLNACLADYITYREQSTTFADVAIWGGRSVSVTEFSDPERVEGIVATFRLLPLLGVQPVLGRHFTEKDNEDKSPQVVMISHAYWKRRFGGERSVIGRRIMADGEAREIIAVLPENFWFLDTKHDLVMPLRYERASVRLAGYNWQAVARLRPGVTLDQANADVARMIVHEMNSFPPPKGMSKQMMEDARLGPSVRWLKTELLGDIGNSLWVVMATIGIVLLIACANVANLLLVRMEGRAQEFAVRAALGAGRGRIAREVFSESVTLSVLGGALGAGFAFFVVKLVLYLSPVRLPRMELINVDAAALLFTFGVSILAGFALAVIPIVKYSGFAVAESLRAGGRNASASRQRNLASHTLTVVQVGLALVLLIGSGLMIRTYQSVRRVHPGFNKAEELQTLRVSIPRTAAPKDEQVRQMWHTLTTRLAAIPGVSEVGIMGGLPMTGATSQDPIMAADHTYSANQIPPLRRFLTTGPGGMHALGAAIRAGREFTWPEVLEGRRVVLVSENFAREYWGSAQAAIGKQIKSNPMDPWHEIVGVVGDIRHDGAEHNAPSTVYWPLRGNSSMPVLLRTTRAGTEGLMNEVRQTIWAVNASLPITDVRTMQYIYERSMARTSFTLTLLAISGGMALLLAVVGVYAVISYTVAQRTKEIGIRVALGAQPGELIRMFVGKGLVWSGIGAAAGLTAAALLSQLMSALLFEISPIDPITYVASAVGTFVAAAAASYLPARRVTRIEPVEALRSE